MEILVAPDSFKGSLTAKEVGHAIKESFELEIPSATVNVFPMADGGEGTLDALIYSTNGKKIKTKSIGPMGEEITTYYGVLGDQETIVIEVALVSGYQMVKIRNPMLTTTYGVGQIIKQALDQGYRKFIIGLGGSATNDGGLGMLQALGGVFLDEQGEPIPSNGAFFHKVTTVKLDSLDPRLKECTIKAASDVMIKLCGPYGASFVFGPQKGATEDDVKVLDSALKNFANLVEKQLGTKYQNVPGSGAAGGLGFGLLCMGAEILSGANLVGESVRLAEKIQTSDWVITGEGQSDYQSLYGKVPVFIAKTARQYGVKTILISGGLGKGYQELYDFFVSCHSIAPGPITLEDSMTNAKSLVFEAARNIARLIKANKI
ncbi:MAG: glycerate kinase [Tuberibacillus sp.]